MVVWALNSEKSDRFVRVVAYGVANLYTAFNNQVPRGWHRLEDIYESLDAEGLLDDPVDDYGDEEPQPPRTKDEMFVIAVADALGSMFVPHMRRWMWGIERKAGMQGLQAMADMEGLLETTHILYSAESAGHWRVTKQDGEALLAKMFAAPSATNKAHPHLTLVE